MHGWSFPLGRWLGVEVRMHLFLLLLLGLSIGVETVATGTGGRGLLLWVLLLATIGVRELAKVLVAAWNGMAPEALLLVPTGAIGSYVGETGAKRAAAERWMGIAGPAANLVFAAVLAGLIRTIAPEIDLFARPWMTPSHLLRSFFWLNLLMGVVNLVPVGMLDGGRAAGSGGGAGLLRMARGGAGAEQAMAIGLILGGLLLGGNLWMILLGALLLIGSQFRQGGGGAVREVETVRMRDVMLMQFSTIPASDTLEDALERSVHTLQDVFPVVRGSSMVGSISRQSLLEALAAGGNSYVQGVMTRSFETAGPDDAVVSTLRRIVGGGRIQLVPVIEGERVVGIVTPQNVAQSMSMLNQQRRMRRTEPAE